VPRFVPCMIRSTTFKKWWPWRETFRGRDAVV